MTHQNSLRQVEELLIAAWHSKYTMAQISEHLGVDRKTIVRAWKRMAGEGKVPDGQRLHIKKGRHPGDEQTPKLPKSPSHARSKLDAPMSGDNRNHLMSTGEVNDWFPERDGFSVPLETRDPLLARLIQVHGPDGRPDIAPELLAAQAIRARMIAKERRAMRRFRKP